MNTNDWLLNLLNWMKTVLLLLRSVLVAFAAHVLATFFINAIPDSTNTTGIIVAPDRAAILWPPIFGVFLCCAGAWLLLSLLVRLLSVAYAKPVLLDNAPDNADKKAYRWACNTGYLVLLGRMGMIHPGLMLMCALCSALYAFWPGLQRNMQEKLHTVSNDLLKGKQSLTTLSSATLCQVRLDGLSDQFVEKLIDLHGNQWRLFEKSARIDGSAQGIFRLMRRLPFLLFYGLLCYVMGANLLDSQQGIEIGLLFALQCPLALEIADIALSPKEAI